jgi:hypothetical protein
VYLDGRSANALDRIEEVFDCFPSGLLIAIEVERVGTPFVLASARTDPPAWQAGYLEMVGWRDPVEAFSCHYSVDRPEWAGGVMELELEKTCLVECPDLVY